MWVTEVAGVGPVTLMLAPPVPVWCLRWWLSRLGRCRVVAVCVLSSFPPVVPGAGVACVVVGRTSPLPEAVEVVVRWARTLDGWMAWVGLDRERRVGSLVGENSLGLVRLFLVELPSASPAGGRPDLPASWSVEVVCVF